jgi:hypothetical protein
MLTHDLDIPNKPSEQPQGWSMRRLLGGFGSVGKVVAAFSPFEFVFLVMILITGVSELFGRDVSWFWYVLIVFVLLVAFSQRRQQVEPKKEEQPKAK